MNNVCKLMISYSNELIGSVEDFNISELVPPSKPLRIGVKDIDELAESIRKIGLLQPIVVRINNSGSFEIVAGNRRFNACKKLGWRKITCHVVELDDKTAFEISMIENVQRQTLNPIEEGLAFRNYVNMYGWGGVSELAEKLSKSAAYVSKRLKLLEMPKEIIDLISNSEINVSIAEELFSVKDKSKQSKLALIIRDKKISTRNARKLIKGRSNYVDTSTSFLVHSNQNTYLNERINKSFDKSIIALRIAMKKLGSVIEIVEDEWIFYDILLHHKNLLNSQIDILLKQKSKYKKNSLNKFIRESVYPK